MKVPPPRPRLRPDITACDAADGMVLLDERTGRYWQLNATAAQVLRALLDGRAPEEIASGLAATHEVRPERAAADIAALIDHLATARLTDGLPPT
ncbi:lasso peptide biosynthesis PqqD family chaperone [Streptomyces millisiae]|uniref:Lasso peptide biosynthesis PqqD family chaperone n=1 Tax=Streptomyces millisiae TaxID=3075542 RepID=A0ABU2LYP4_9ACTN|nr:lasso peptide biosynthesis PqqD family chaperone [Streptomyces sp. DSM 44918]MDT0322272.1 lasso peptide biosynthesis PqqD family chaperone [Streptomyces sp. DSM 44918]